MQSKKFEKAARRLQKNLRRQLSKKREFEKLEKAVSPKATPKRRSSASSKMTPTPMRRLSNETNEQEPDWLQSAERKASQLKKEYNRITPEDIAKIRNMPTDKSLLASSKLVSELEKREFKKEAMAGTPGYPKWKGLDSMARCSPKSKRNALQYCCQAVVFDKKTAKLRQCQKTLTAEDYERGETMCTTHRN